MSFHTRRGRCRQEPAAVEDVRRVLSRGVAGSLLSKRLAKSNGSLLYITARRRFQRRVLVAAEASHRGLTLAGVFGQPGEPVVPPTAGLLLGTLEPAVGIFRDQVVCPVMALLLGRRVDDACDMPGSTEDKTLGSGEQGGAGVGAPPGHDMVVMGGQDEGRGVDGAQVELDPAALQLSRLQVVLQIGVAQVPADR